jgi:predicted ATP-dependent endonuclease of OLD family
LDLKPRYPVGESEAVMQLTRVVIHNFRCLIDVDFAVDGYSLLVGANNAGKTCVVDALRCFYENDLKYTASRDFPQCGSSDQESWADLTFHLDVDEWDNLPDRYKHYADNTLRVRKYFSPPDGSEYRANTAYGYESASQIAIEPMFGAKGVQQGKLGTLIYVPAVSRLDDHTKMTGPSALRELVNGILKSVLDKSDSYGALARQFGAFADEVKSERSPDGRSISELEERLNQSLSGWGAKFVLNIRKPELVDIVKNLVDSDLVDESHGAALKAEQFGAGLQRHLIYSLIRLTAEYVEPPAPKKKKEFSPDFTLLLFEEPEVFLHPPQQEVMWTSLRSIVTTSKTWSVLCSTHSPVLVNQSANDLKRIARLVRIDGVSTVYAIDAATWESIVDHNRVINELKDRYPQFLHSFEAEDDKWGDPDAFEATHYLSWLTTDRASCVFSRHVILVEGASDQALIRRLLADGKMKESIAGVCVLDCLGKRNIHRCIRLLTALGIRHSVIADGDEGGQGGSAAWNEIITDAASSLTTRVDFIKHNLEHFLGIPPNGRHKVPRLLRAYERAELKPDAIAGLVTIVQTHIS